MAVFLQSFFKFKSTGAINLIIGFQIITIFYTICYVFLSYLPKAIYLNYVLIIILTFSFIIIKLKKIKIKWISVNNFLSLFVIIFIFALANGISLKFHSSPDSHGFAATVSYISDYPSLSKIQLDFMETTKSPLPVHLGQKTPLMNSTWNILDSRLRFASDTILTVGRIGMPVYISTFLIPNQIENFTYLIIIFGIFVAWLISLGLISIVNFKEHGKSKFYKELMIVIVVLSPISMVWILEATLNQLCLLLVVSQTLFLSIKLIRNEINNFEYNSMQIINVLFCSSVYPQGIPFFLALYLIISILNIRLNKLFISFFNILMPLFASLFILFFTVRYSINTMISNFISGISGIPYQLGSIDLISSTLWIFNGIDFTKAVTSTEGFGNIKNNYTSVLIQILIFSLITLIIILKTKIQKKIKFFTIMVIGIGFAGVINGVKGAQEGNSYIYVRYLVLYLIVYLAVYMYLISENKNLKKFMKNKLIMIIILPVFLLQILIGFYKIKDFNSVSENFIIWNDSIDKKIFNKNSLFVSDEPKHKYFSLTLLGTFNYLTDNWNPLINVENNPKIYEVYYIVEKQKNIDIKYIGEYMFSKNIYGPISYLQLLGTGKKSS